MSDLGIRKTSKTQTLKKLNLELGLGLDEIEIENMSTSQLRRTIFKIKEEKKLKQISSHQYLQEPAKYGKISPNKYHKRRNQND